MEITISQAQGRVPVSIIRLKGDLDYLSVDLFEAQARQAVEDGAKDILIDLSGVGFMSSVGIRSLHQLYDLVQAGESEEKKAVYKGVLSGTYKAPHFKLLKPTRRVHDTLKTIGLDMYIDIFEEEQKAIAAF
jgi:anti-anti-sigma factor